MGQKGKIIFSNLVVISLIYVLVAFFFSIAYMILDYYELGPIIDHNSSANHQQQPLDRFTRSLYFSFITLYSVGYGDVTPFGLSKAVAILEATIGYLLPPAIIIRYLIFTPKSIQDAIYTRMQQQRRG
ncbi:ion channel [Ammoniphilus sp. YIM 78166]|uniref:ion channel n=1 Tax=Ammoniphilus sp. YIM 78166 TaxID=1644106 RepID=UPI00106F4F11|nr:ion channel [Ammoniphilus sp. YIM 78166]